MLIADELTSNALRHGGAPVAAALSRAADRWLVAVSDSSTDVPPGRRRRAATPASAGSASTSSPTSRPPTAGRPQGGAKIGLGRHRGDAASEPTRATRPTRRDSRVTSGMSLVDQLDTVTDASAGTVDRHATTADLRVDRPGAPMPSSASSRCTTRTPCGRPSSAPAPPPRSGPRSGFDGRKQRLAA